MTGHRSTRLFVARFFYEANSFGPLVADGVAFKRCEWARGGEAIAEARGSGRELAALAGFVDQHPDWSLAVSRCTSAMPAGPIDDAFFADYVREVLTDLEYEITHGGVDAIYLSLHGAAVTQTHQTPELEFLRAIRAKCPTIALAATFDMHANLHPAIGDLLSFGIGYRTHPHLDMEAVAQTALGQLCRLVEHETATHCALVNTGVLLPSINMRTADGPMRGLQVLALQAQEEPGVLVASVFGGFPYADTAHTGASTLVYTDKRLDPDGRTARSVAEELARRIGIAAPAFFVRLPDPAEGIARAVASRKPGLVAVTDAADNPFSGGAADTPALLAALLDANPGFPCVFASLADPSVVADARRAGLGKAVTMALGATHGSSFGLPVTASVVPVLFTDGRYVATSALFRDLQVECGNTVVLAVEKAPHIRIIVTEHVDAAIDLAFYKLHGISLENERLLCVKGKNHFRAAAGSLCAEIIDVDAPGPACLDFSRLPYHFVTREQLGLPDAV